MMNPYEDKTKYGGDTRWYDADGNGQIDEKDICYMGNTYPKWTGGISKLLELEEFRFVPAYGLYDRTYYLLTNRRFSFVDAGLVISIYRRK